MSSLLLSRRFLPLFVTQFLGAFNDNLFKNALVITVTYKIVTGDAAAQMVNLAFGLFMLPMLLFSALAGEIADKCDRARIARWVKLSEIALAVIGGAGLYLNNLPLLMLTLFLFGMHSTFFGPVKYAILPQHLRPTELVGGNAWVEAGTFIAILAGTILSGLFILDDKGPILISCGLIVTACAGYIASRAIPAAPGPMPDMKLNWNPVTATISMIGFSARNRDEFRCILAISWFWFIGALFLAQFAPYASQILHADAQVVTLFLVVFSLGIAAGSMLYARLVKDAARAAPVSYGAWGMSIFAADLFLTSRDVTAPTGPLIGVAAFLHQAIGIHVLLDLFALALCGGIYIVPLYTLLQTRADHRHLARAIAGNNLINALFMVASAAFAVGGIACGLTIPQLFLCAALLNAAVAFMIGKFIG